jgi:hypothetical protein
VEIGFRVFYVSVFVEPLGYAIQDTIRTGRIGETVVHGPGAPAHPRKARSRILVVRINFQRSEEKS